MKFTINPDVRMTVPNNFKVLIGWKDKDGYGNSTWFFGNEAEDKIELEKFIILLDRRLLSPVLKETSLEGEQLGFELSQNTNNIENRMFNLANSCLFSHILEGRQDRTIENYEVTFIDEKGAVHDVSVEH